MEGMGAPPMGLLEASYHFRLVPVAVRAAEGLPWQISMGLVAVGAAGTPLTSTVIVVLALSQPVEVSCETLYV